MTIIDETLYDRVQQQIDAYRTNPVLVSEELINGDITFEEFLKSGETDPKQQTQAVTKFLQYFFAPAMQWVIKQYNLPIIPGGAAGCDWIYVGNQYQNPMTGIVEYNHDGLNVPIEFKSAGGQDNNVLCLGNLGVNVKVDVTLVCRYGLKGNYISHKQTVVDHASAAKWKLHNQGKFDPETGESKGSNFSGLKSLGLDLEGNSIDLPSLVFYSGTYKEGQAKVTKNGYQHGWVKFIKEEIVYD